jgi:hypothetical protein
MLNSDKADAMPIAGRLWRDDRGWSIPEYLRFGWTHRVWVLDNVFSLGEKQRRHSFDNPRTPYVAHRNTKTVVVPKVKYVRKNISGRNAEVSNGFVAGGTRVLGVNEERVFVEENEVSVHSVSESEFV